MRFSYRIETNGQSVNVDFLHHHLGNERQVVINFDVTGDLCTPESFVIDIFVLSEIGPDC